MIVREPPDLIVAREPGRKRTLAARQIIPIELYSPPRMSFGTHLTIMRSDRPTEGGREGLFRAPLIPGLANLDKHGGGLEQPTAGESASSRDKRVINLKVGRVQRQKIIGGSITFIRKFIFVFPIISFVRVNAKAGWKAYFRLGSSNFFDRYE